jgi:hypothetical protein
VATPGWQGGWSISKEIADGTQDPRSGCWTVMVMFLPSPLSLESPCVQNLPSNNLRNHLRSKGWRLRTTMDFKLGLIDNGKNMESCMEKGCVLEAIGMIIDRIQQLLDTSTGQTRRAR